MGSHDTTYDNSESFTCSSKSEKVAVALPNASTLKKIINVISVLCLITEAFLANQSDHQEVGNVSFEANVA